MKKHKFFAQDFLVIKDKWYRLVEPLLIDFEIEKETIERVKDAYFYFASRPHEFDGATLVADRYFVNGLDITAMLHDYLYINSKNIFQRIKADVKYAIFMRKLKFEWYVAWGRCVLLIIINLLGIYSLYKLIKYKKYE